MKKIVIAVVVAILVFVGLIFNTVRENKLTDNFKTYVQQNQESFEQALIGKNQHYYYDFQKDTKEAIEFKAVTSMNKLKAKYEGLKDQAIVYDKQYLGGELDDLSNMDLNKLKPEDREAINKEIQEAVGYYNKGLYASAEQLITQIKANINSKLKTK